MESFDRPTLLKMLTIPSATTARVASAFSRVSDPGFLGETDFVRELLRSTQFSDEDFEALSAFLSREWSRGSNEMESLEVLFAAVLECMMERELAPVEIIRFGAHFLAVAGPSVLRSAFYDYMKTTGPRNDYYRHWVVQEFNEENYASRSKQIAQPHSSPNAASWQDWETQGWQTVDQDWPIADLFFELATEEEVNSRLSRMRFVPVPASETLQYYLLRRLWQDKETSLERVGALGQLIRTTANAPALAALYGRALLVFRRHWNLLPIKELTLIAAEVYAELCVLNATFEPDFSKFPPELEGMDFGHLENVWPLDHELWERLATNRFSTRRDRV